MSLIAVLFAVADVFIGTSGVGNTQPAAAYPFGLVQAGPDVSERENVFRAGSYYCSGYQLKSPYVWRFSQTHLSGTGCPGLGNFGIMPFGGEWDPGKRGFKKDFESEKGEPGYYTVTIENGLGAMKTEIAALEHTAVYRFRFGECGKAVRLLVDLDWAVCNRCDSNTMSGAIWWLKFVRNSYISLADENTVKGGHSIWTWNDYAYHFALKTSAPIKSITTLREPDGKRGGIHVLEFGEIPGGELRVRIALSNTSPDAAERNMLAEAPTDELEVAKSAGAAAWRGIFDFFELDPKTDERTRKNFEAAVYHLCFQPNRQSDVGAKPVYSTFSLWDTFRAAHPLYTLIRPDLNTAFVESMLDQCDRQGYLPIWALGGGENHCMIGHHAVPVVVDAYLKGLLGPDQVDRAYRAVRQSLTVNHKAINDGTWGLMKEDWDVLDKYGYYPFDKLGGAYGMRKVRGESVSRTLECAYDDACAAKFASALGRTEDAAFFSKRAQSWKNVFDRSVGYMRGKDSNGKWREPFNKYAMGVGPFDQSDFCEGGTMQYTWHVMQDPAGLAEAMGGEKAMGERLDQLFTERPPSKDDEGFHYNISGCLGQCVHGNEISHHIAYLYAWTDRPWRMGEILRQICEINYKPTPDGLCGNDDCGQMSAWYVFTVLGFYPVDPCGGEYVLGVPQAPGVKLNLPNGKKLAIRVDGYAPEKTRVKSVKLNGRLLGRTISHADILAGGELVFEM